jgi:succinate dehydrogenase/fumarate reductase flavoprotein subunit
MTIKSSETIGTDVLVIGAGLAGLRAAIQARR